jgi:predicted phage terminase large subunit-like protein
MNSPFKSARPIQAEADAIFRSDFPSFVQKCFHELNPGTAFDAAWHIDAIAHVASQIMIGSLTRAIVNLPPRSLKSLILSIALPAYILGHDPRRKIICVSYSQDLSDKLSLDFRRIVETNWHRRLFPQFKLVRNATNEITTTQGGFRLATSVGGTMTGRGGDLILIDDPINASEVLSKSTRESVVHWYKTALLSRLDNQSAGAIMVIMQRLHPDDLTGHLIEQGGWELLSLPAIAPEDRVIRLPYGKFRCWAKGEPLQPNRMPLAILDSIKNSLGADHYNAQFLQTPLPETGVMLRRDWLGVYDVAPLPVDGDEIVQSWDTAMKATDSADYSVCLTFRVRNKNQYFLLNVFRARLEFPELSKIVVSHAQEYRANTILIEDAGSGTSLIQTAKQQGLQGVIGLKPKTDKETRMYTQTAKLEAKSLFVPKNAHWLNDFMTEYLSFPKCRHDDQIDALSQFLLYRTNKELDGGFRFDFGHDGDEGSAPDPDSILWWLRR